MKKILVLIFSIFIVQLILGQEVDDLKKQTFINKAKTTKTIRAGYGTVLAGSGDLWGQKFLLGAQYFLTKHSAIDSRFSATLIDVDRYFLDNPDWKYNQVSNGLEFILEYNYVFQYKKMRFYPSFGPVIRYSYEKHASSFGIRLNSDTQNYDWFCNIDEDKGLRFGYEFGLNADFTIFNYLTIGPRFSFSQFPQDGYTFAFMGFTLIKQGL